MSYTLEISNYDFFGSKNLILKYQKFTSLGCKDKGIRKFELVGKTQFLYFKDKTTFNSSCDNHVSGDTLF